MKTKKTANVAGQFVIGCKQTVIGIELRRLLVVVSRTDIGVKEGLALHPFFNQAKLGVHFQSGHAENDFDAFFHQSVGPVNVRLFIETGLQFHNCRHLLSVLRGVNQRIYHHRVFCQTIQRDLNAPHMRINGRFRQKVDEYGETLIRIMKDKVLFVEVGKYALVRIDIRVRQRFYFFVNQFFPVSDPGNP